MYQIYTSTQSRRVRGPKGQAQVLTEEQFQKLREFAVTSCNAPLSAELKLLLSFRAGLRACEISTLRITRSMLDGEGNIARCIRISATDSKNGRERVIPMHPEIADSLRRLRRAYPTTDFIAFSGRFRRIKHQSVAAVTKWFNRLYIDAGFVGCSSHSGRRTFITHLARVANHFNNSLRDVQRIAGHARLDTTERYIDPSHDVSALVSSLGRAPRPQPTRSGAWCA